MEKRTEKYEQMIREGIDRAYLANLLKKREEVKVHEHDYAGDFRREAKEIIEHIKDANEEIYIIENMEKKALKTVNQNINNELAEISIYLDMIIKNKDNKIKDLKNIVSELIDNTGPKKDATFLLLNIKRTMFDLITRHSINVCLIAIATAIELTKMMTQKLNDESVKGDFKKLAICNNKIFNKDELVELGVSALLHDIGLIEYFPNLTENSKFNVKEKSKIEMHTSNAFHLLSTLKVDYEIRKAILQHHERIDSSGYPDGIKARHFSKYALVLSFADKIELLGSKNPFEKKLHPHQAIMHILTKERYKFDNDVTLAYCKAASLYPIGSWLFLSNNKICFVFKVNKTNLKKPIVKAVYTSEMKELLKKEFIDLSKSKLTIKELIDIESLQLVDKGIEKYLFDEREFNRMNVDISGKGNFIDTNIVFNINIKDISAGGMKLSSDKEIKLGNEIYIDFHLNGKIFNHIKSMVVWNNVDTGHYGIRFINMEDEYKKYILNLT